MRALLLLFVLDLLNPVSSQVYSLSAVYISPVALQLAGKNLLQEMEVVKFTSPAAPVRSWRKHLHRSSSASAASPTILAPIAAPYHGALPRHHRGHRHKRPYLASPAPAPVAPAPAPVAQGCEQTCLDPLTSTPIGSPCGCVVPMKVKLILSVAVYALFPVVNELEIEIAAGTYLKHSQVQIVGATADVQNQDKTDVDINLVPLGEKFDNTTATLTYERFVKKEVPLNETLFGRYDVVFITYPGIPSLPSPAYIGSGPSGSTSGGEYPITADVSNRREWMNPRAVFIIVFSAVLVLLASLAAIYVFIKCRKLGKPSNAVGPVFASSTNKRSGLGSTLSSSIGSSPSMSLYTTMPTCALSVKTFTLSELEKATEKFSSMRILGGGGFGRVYYGILDDETEVAVKLLTKDNLSGDREFIAEVEMLSRLHHRNLVKLIGICIEGHRRCLIYELVHNGSVESHLHGVDGEKEPLDWDARMKIAIGAARGLAYLHEDSNPRVIHRDFKASNVLLEDDFTPKVSDFGLAREATEGSHHVSTRVMGTFGYVAPEYAMTGHLLVKSDVYSYGVVLLELLTGRKPVDMSQPQGQENLVTWARPLLSTREGIEKLVNPALSCGSHNFDDIAKVAAIASMCVHPEVTHRPFMGEVVQALKLIYNDSEEGCGDCTSQRDSSIQDLDSKSDIGPSDSSWWNAGAASPHLTYGQASPFITMEYSSGPLEEMGNQTYSGSSLVGGERVALPVKHGNRSGPLRTIRSKAAFFRMKGSMSEHGLIPKRTWSDGSWL